MSEDCHADVVGVCSGCGTQIAPRLLSCPSCGRLVHAEELKRLALEAEAASQVNDIAKALQQWDAALKLLPAISRQYQVISAKVAALSEKTDKGPLTDTGTSVPVSDTPRSSLGWGKSLGGAGAIALLAWKFKFVLAFLLTKGKLLLLGFTKAGTVFTMLASLGVYWTAWGWKFALGLVLSIYVHEMGHVAALRRYGLKASAPMFIPGLGAFVRLKQSPANARQDARVGLAGPLWGLAAAVGTWGVGRLLHWPSWAAIAHVAAWINLFNLLPIWQLDGSRGFRALSRAQRWLIVVAIGGVWLWTGEGLLVLLLIVALGRALVEKGSETTDWPAFASFSLLIVLLSLFFLPAAHPSCLP